MKILGHVSKPSGPAYVSHTAVVVNILSPPPYAADHQLSCFSWLTTPPPNSW